MSLTVLPQFAGETPIVRPYQWLAGLQVLDVATTWIILWFWSTRAEGNPVAAAMLHSYGLTLGLAMLLVLKLGVVWLFWRCQTKVRLASAIYGVVIANNLVFLGIGLWLAL